MVEGVAEAEDEKGDEKINADIDGVDVNSI